ncbi:MAG: hydroxyisourate hydrolase [Bacteroidota bacterium]
MSQLTTHILDTSIGKPAKGIKIQLIKNGNTIAEGITDNDGRIADLLPKNQLLEIGDYKIVFEVAGYFSKQNKKTFYPRVIIHFTVFDDSHYHVPLLLNPFGYSTYRGS